jgi:WD40 repeat protein
VSTGELLWELTRRDGFGQIAFSGDGKIRVNQAEGIVVELRDARTNALRHRLLQNAGGGPFAFSPQGDILATGEWATGTVRLWNMQTGALVRTLEPPSVQRGSSPTHIARQSVTSLIFLLDGATLIVGNGDSPSTALRLWNARTGKELKTVPMADTVFTMALSPDGQWLVTGGVTGTMRLWNTSTWEVRQVIKGSIRSVNTVAFSPDGKLLASAGRSGDIKLWKVG